MGSEVVVLDPRRGLDRLVAVLVERGHRVIGPVLADGVVTLRELTSGDELPTGLEVDQRPGAWRSRTTDGPTRFGWTPAADSWKTTVLPPTQEVLRVRRRDGSWVATAPVPPERPPALLGARACELAALAVLDRVLLDHDHPDQRYGARRDGTFVVAVVCGRPAATCWCTSAGGGPSPADGWDVRLTEIPPGMDAGGHRLLAEAGTPAGAEVLAALPSTPAADADRLAADDVASGARRAIAPRVDATSLPGRLRGIDLDAHWEEVATRCLSCGNCTAVCPTCFCSSFTDTAGADPDESVRVQEWVSCFQLDHSNLGGRPVRATTASRYRQWLTHKLVTWQEQMGTLGCVGCGRCTTWCPAGIDLPAEAALLAAHGDDREGAGAR